MVKIIVLVLAGCIAVALIVTAVWAYAPDTSKADLAKRFDDTSTRYLDLDGAQVRIRDNGDSGAPAIIFVHGFGSSLETWQPWADALSDRYRVIRFDLPGCGLSETDRSADYSDAHTLSVIRQLMQRLDIDHAVMVGNSLGGRIAWQFAVAFPDKVTKLALISPDGFASPGFAYGQPAQIPAVLQLMKYFLPKALLRPNLAAAYADPLHLSDATVDRYYQLLLASGNREAMIDRMRQTILQDPVPLLRKIRIPTLLLWGVQDHLIPYANSADYLAALPNGRLVSFADLGHVPHEEAPAESLQPLQAFLAQSP